MRAYLEARCPDNHFFEFLVGAPARCPACGWLFKVRPKTAKDFDLPTKTGIQSTDAGTYPHETLVEVTQEAQ